MYIGFAPSPLLSLPRFYMIMAMAMAVATAATVAVTKTTALTLHAAAAAAATVAAAAAADCGAMISDLCIMIDGGTPLFLLAFMLTSHTCI